MSEPKFYSEDLDLIHELAKAWGFIANGAKEFPGATPGGVELAANISLIAALHKRCEAAEARVKDLEESRIPSRVRELEAEVRRLADKCL